MANARARCLQKPVSESTKLDKKFVISPENRSLVMYELVATNQALETHNINCVLSKIRSQNTNYNFKKQSNDQATTLSCNAILQSINEERNEIEKLKTSISKTDNWFLSEELFNHIELSYQNILKSSS